MSSKKPQLDLLIGLEPDATGVTVIVGDHRTILSLEEAERAESELKKYIEKLRARSLPRFSAPSSKASRLPRERPVRLDS